MQAAIEKKEHGRKSFENLIAAFRIVFMNLGMSILITVIVDMITIQLFQVKEYSNTVFTIFVCKRTVHIHKN